MRGVPGSSKIQRIRENSEGRYAGTCVKVVSYEGYELADEPYAKPPKKRRGMSKNTYKMLELLCRVHPTHLVTHKFIMGMMGRSHNTIYKYIREATELKLIVAYRLVSADNLCMGMAYRPVTYLANYKYAKNKNVNSKIRAGYVRTRRVVKKTIEEDVHTRIHTHIHTDVCTSMHTRVLHDEKSGKNDTENTTSKTAELVTPVYKLYLKPYLGKERERSATSSSSASPTAPTSEVLKKRNPGRRTAALCRESCRNEYRPIVEILLQLSSDGSSLDIDNLPGALARSIDYRVNPDRLGTLTMPIAIQLRMLHERGFLPELTCNDLVRGFKGLMHAPERKSIIKAIINDVVTTYAGVFPGQREYHQYKTKLYGLDECIAFVKSKLTSYEKFMSEYAKQDYSALYNPIALTQAARMHKIDWRWGKTITYEEFYRLDIGSRAWLSHECRRDNESFWEVFGLEVHCPVNILWWDEETKARRAFARIGLDFESVKAEIGKVGSSYYDTSNIADVIAPHLNTVTIKDGK